MVRHCPTCGRDSNTARFYGEFCEHCTRAKFEGKLGKRTIEIKRCKRCGRIFVAGAFADQTDEAIAVLAQRSLKGYETKLIDCNDSEARVSITERVAGEPVTVQKTLPINWEKTVCDTCVRRAAGYYEAVMQLRGSPSRVQTMLGRASRYFERNGEYVSRIASIDAGYDLYLSSKRLAAHFLELQGIKPTISYTLHGLKNGKKLYRNTYAVHL